jgi:hypothetical protein
MYPPLFLIGQFQTEVLQECVCEAMEHHLPTSWTIKLHQTLLFRCYWTTGYVVPDSFIYYLSRFILLSVKMKFLQSECQYERLGNQITDRFSVTSRPLLLVLAVWELPENIRFDTELFGKLQNKKLWPQYKLVALPLRTIKWWLFLEQHHLNSPPSLNTAISAFLSHWVSYIAGILVLCALIAFLPLMFPDVGYFKWY